MNVYQCIVVLRNDRVLTFTKYATDKLEMKALVTQYLLKEFGMVPDYIKHIAIREIKNGSPIA